MKLYYSPGACSLAGHIALNEADMKFDLAKVDLKGHKLEDGRSFRDINPKGYVPALELDDGELLTENVAILALIADPASRPLRAGCWRGCPSAGEPPRWPGPVRGGSDSVR